MADRSAIEWCDSTFNPWTGCTKVSPACDHCYAESWSKRAGTKVGQWGHGAPRVRTTAANWRKPVAWNATPYYQCSRCRWRGEASGAQAACPQCPCPTLAPTRRRVFCASLADVFDNEVDPQWRADLFALIRATPNLDWLLLTKRIGNAASMIADAVASVPRDAACGTGQFNHTPMAQWPWPNVWLGATICNQAEADRDTPKLLATPARVRFLSIEPMLGPINLNRVRDPNFRVLGSALNGAGYQSRIDWVIVGGESGAHARPSHPDWFRSLRDQCAEAAVPFLFKQWGEWWEADSDARDRDTGGHIAVDADSLDGEDLWDSRTGSLVAIDGRRFTPETLPEDTPGRLMVRIGKKAAGRLLDGRTHDGFPLTLQAGGDRAG